MTRLRRILRPMQQNERQEKLLDAELRFDYDQRVEANLRAGMSEPEARRAVRLKFGGLEQVKEECRDARPTRWLETAWPDLRFAFRALRKQPGFTIAVIATLALGIGVNVAIFSVVNTVLLKPLRAPDPDRVVVFMATNSQGSGSLASEIKFNLWREQTSVFEEVSGYRTGLVNLTGVEQPRQISAIFVTQNYFQLFGLPVAKGRGFTEEEERAVMSQLFENGHVVILSDAFWKSAFSADPKILGRVISLSGDAYRVVGVMASGVETETAEPPQVWLPFLIGANSDRQVHYFQTVGRLRPDRTLEQANAQLQLVTKEFRRKFPNSLSTSRGDIFSVRPMQEVLVRDARASLLILSGAVSLVLLIACANVANLLLAKAASRQREIAIRGAMGATRGRIVRQLLTESALLSVAAAVLGLGLGSVGSHALLVLNLADLPRIGVAGNNVTMDWRVLAFTLLTTLFTGVLFGLAPALKVSREDVSGSLRNSSGRTGTGFRQNRSRSLLVISEVSLALVLLIGAVLLIRSLISLRSVNPGFDPNHLVITQATLDPRYTKTLNADQIVDNVLRSVTALPEVESAAFANLLPLVDFNSLPIIVVGRALDGPSHGNSRWTIVSPSYFEALRIPLVRGRLFTETDRRNTQGVAVINQTMARQLWPAGDPVGSQILIGKGLGPNFEEPPRQIVGIVGDVREDALADNPLPAVFIPVSQLPGPLIVRPMWVVVRARDSASSFNSTIEAELRRATGGQPVAPLRPMKDIIVRSTDRQSFNMWVMTIFGGSALLLAAIGIYGLIAYSVEQRTQEIGIRLALGAGKGAVKYMIVLQGMRLALTGVALGVAGAFMTTRLLASFLFGVQARDAITFISAPLLLLTIALFACYFPARRAARVDPAVALRWE